MKIIVAGASGVIGRALIPLLLKAGHEVVGLTRNTEHAEELKDKGVQPVILDIYDR
ncbi:NAD(P)H-binding protein, partial [Paenibacillus sepulcri]|nr:NAD(P)H-binding protein [Paenibacillus sepulcri]